MSELNVWYSADGSGLQRALASAFRLPSFAVQRFRLSTYPVGLFQSLAPRLELFPGLIRLLKTYLLARQ